MTTFLGNLSTDFALVFGGQGSKWRAALDASVSLPKQGERVRAALAAARSLLAPVALDVLTKAPGASDRLDTILAGDSTDDVLDTNPAVSGPGIVLAQYAALLDLEGTGLDLHATSPTTLLGHSQGILGVALARAYMAGDEAALHRVIALSVLVGAAAAHATHTRGATSLAGMTPMLSVSGVPTALIGTVVTTLSSSVVMAVNNGVDGQVLSGLPADLEAARHAISAAVDAHNAALDAHTQGGSPLNASFDVLRVDAPFHNPLMETARLQVLQWVDRLNAAGRTFDSDLARELAAAILTEPCDWVAQVRSARDADVKYFLDLGPTPMVGRLTAPLLEGTGSAVVDASTRSARTSLDLPGFEVPEPTSWEKFLPRLVRLPDGRTVVDTAFTRLTGKSPVVLPGMTPTTVWPEIVAAAANAGNWAEMAGGGQYSEEVFTENRLALQELLEPGRTAGFNTMFFDRFMWNLQFGVNRIVPKARRAGAPIDMVTIAAGIPELDEAGELLTQLKADGFSFVCLKPGTVEQINQVLDIADAHPDFPLIVQVEDGHSGGHHSWEDLDHLLLATYARIRNTPSVVLAVGGGIGRPVDAARYVTGRWALEYDRPLMPVDAVLVGTAAMATLEARTSPQVKKLLMETPGADGDGWVGRGESRGGITSGFSHLGADMHEIENSSSRASRLIHDLGGDLDLIRERRNDIIDALARTAKPYFGDVEEMTYAQWASRVVELSYPWADWTWQDRTLDLFHRIEARLNDADHGQVPTLFADASAIEDGPAALAALLDAYPQAATTKVAPSDAAWFPTLCRKHHKPMPFVPVLDGELARWWGTDTLWQSHDARFDADSVRIIPGPRSVAGIDRIDEPVGELFARFEAAIVEAAAELGAQTQDVFSRFGNARTVEEYLRRVPTIQWAGNLVANPAFAMPQSTSIVEEDGQWGVLVHCETPWDGLGEDAPHAVREILIPLTLPVGVSTGAFPVVDMARLSVSAYDLLAGAAGVGTTTVNGDVIEAMPAVTPDDGFGIVHDSFTLSKELGRAHSGVTGAALRAQLTEIVPDALVGPCWPAIYTALGSAIKDGVPVIEGLVNAVHLDHTVVLESAWPEAGTRIDVTSTCAELSESSAGRVVRVELELFAHGTLFARLTERFAIRGRVASTQPPSAGPSFAPGVTVEDTARSFIRRAVVSAPADMTAFANVSGDFNPIHTSAAAAGLSGLHAPLVHGMWLSATAQHVIEAEGISGTDAAPATGVIRGQRAPKATIVGWSYQMHGMVNLRDDVEITVERVGRVGGQIAVEATCRIHGEVVSIGRALLAAPRSAYVFPGQGIQRARMGMDNMSPVVRDVWKRADEHTRTRLGFSIEAIVRDNPTQLRIGDEVLRHPDGVLNLTQFTQVALATLAYAQTQDLRASGTFVEDAVYAGHSLGEYNALSACAQIFPFEQVLEIVYQRGTAMHHLVERDEYGQSNYRLGALRPNQIGVSEDDVQSYVASIAEATGEFLQIVNFNLAGTQYAVAGTVAGLEALAADAQRKADEVGGKRPFMLIPGIDVPFHSSRLHAGVAPFRDKLEAMVPHDLNVSVLIGRYIPNLVARPFELTEDFARSIVEVVPSQAVEALLADGWDKAMETPVATARTILIELLAWQFASPVRWIETQDLLFTPLSEGGLGVERLVEVGLGSAPTLANLAERTLALPRHRGRSVEVFNSERDNARLLATDVVRAPSDDAPTAEEAPANEAPAPSAPTPAATPAPSAAPAPAASASAPSGAAVADLPLKASEAVRILLAYANKLRVEQIDAADTVDTLTNGVSSKRNQLLMDMAAELSVPTIDGAAEATISALLPTVDGAAGAYRPFGPVLGEAITSRLRKLFGGAGLAPTHVASRVTGTWQLGQGWADRVSAEILLGTRDGDSVRGGALTSLPTSVTSASDADALIDAAVEAVAAAAGVAVAMPGAGGDAGGGVVDSAALNALTEKMLGADGLLAKQARSLLAELGVDLRATATDGVDSELAALAEAVEAELGAGWVDSVKPAFTPSRAVLLDDRWASAREDLARVASGQLNAAEVYVDGLRGAGQSLAELAQWYTRFVDDERKDFFNRVADIALETADGAFADDVALVTGAAPRSIAAAVVARLLEGGATVVMTSSRVDDARLTFAKDLYRRHAAMGATLWLVPANMASLRDVDSLVNWIGTQQTETAGATTTVVKPALLPTLFFPFAAPPVRGTLGSDPHAAMAQERLLLWSVERSIHQLASLDTSTAVGHRVHVVLPGSPNRGIFGGDGAYAEAKASFDTIVNKWGTERGWPSRVTLAHPRIGWVKGTSLMGGNDLLVPAAEAAGVHVYTPEEITDGLIALATRQAREQALVAPLDADLTGGLADAGLDLPALAAAERRKARDGAGASANDKQVTTIGALPNIVRTGLAQKLPWGQVRTALADQVVIVGVGEVSAWGSGRTRFQAEHADSTIDLTAAGVLELAWMTGLVHWADSPAAGWYDKDGNAVDEADIYGRFRDEVVARAGIRPLVDDSTIVDGGSDDVATVYLNSDQEFAATSEVDARAYVAADPARTSIWFDTVRGEWMVRKAAGSAVRVPRRATLTRSVGGQIPDDFDPAKWGIPATMIEALDRIAVWNLVTAVDAFIASGFSPAELLRAVHPADVSSTQGTGIGGMESLRKVFLDRFLGEERPQDILQEALPNVVAAHTMQAYVGGYGQMIHPVGACATAAISIEEGVDKILLGKSDFVVAGGIDDIAVESLTGFGDMNATAESAALYERGISYRHFSRAGDRRRAGFLEAEGGGTVLLARGSVAADLGLPVLGVVAYVRSFADGAHTSIPAPGIGAMAAGRGKASSQLAEALAALGMSADDIAVVSKHDTSTRANDPNEAELHSTLAAALGRTPGNPLHVISQKTVTGHAKGGAALFQTAGLVEVFREQQIPGNRALDCLDPAMKPWMPLLWLRRPLDMSATPVRAGVLTSLGFGHVSALVVLAHPTAFEVALESERGEASAAVWRETASQRLSAGRAHLEQAMIGRASLYEPVEGRRLPSHGTHDVEAQMLLDPNARLGDNGTY
ncbi:type I polyketide synthase [Schaalia suimastitidis]|uniref:type I polyketide synthase n=1 Tax=Schaalia suimastitidis TaxID=121163 RepID=UPI000429D1A1|nr:type I polyketide synthase [Schaalia suimastitidis]